MDDGTTCNRDTENISCIRSREMQMAKKCCTYCTYCNQVAIELKRKAKSIKKTADRELNPNPLLCTVSKDKLIKELTVAERKKQNYDRFQNYVTNPENIHNRHCKF